MLRIRPFRPGLAHGETPPSDRRERSRGQSLVEFALVIPIILFLTLIALDFGRVYLGYINLQNMSRIAANFAANNPDAWGTPGDTAVQAKYKNQILADAVATNCTLPKVGGVTQVPTPTFTDTNGDGKTNSLGDEARVQISCTFGVITPVISNVVGGSVAVAAQAYFPVKTGMTAFGSGGGGGGTAPNAAFMANGVISGPGVTLNGIQPFAVDFRDTSGGAPTSWSWDLGIGTTTAQDPLINIYPAVGSYLVTLTAINIHGTSTATMTINVVPASTVNFTANPTSGTAGMTVTFTSTSTAGGTAFNWTFGTGEGTGTGATTTHTYSTAGTYTVSLTVTYPAPTGDITTTKTGLITVAAPLCLVPELNGQKINKEQSTAGKWYLAGFPVANLSIGPGVPNGNGNWTIKTQTITANSSVPCTATIKVNDH